MKKRMTEREEAARELELYRSGRWVFEGTPEEWAEERANLERLTREGSTEPPPMSFERVLRGARMQRDPETTARLAAKILAVAAAFDIPTKTDADLKPLYQVLDGYRQYREVGQRGPEGPDVTIGRIGLYTPPKRGPYRPTLDLIEAADDILVRYYVGHGFPLTLRQLFYQLVTKNILRNTPAEYKKISDVMRDARYWGLVSWDMLIDRGRTVWEFETYDDEADALDHLGETFAVDMWDGQPVRVEVWVEKDAAIGTIEAVCRELQVPWASTRGYNSTSGAKAASRRLLRMMEQQDVLILHIADHDPSGVDMSRDLEDRITEFDLADNDTDHEFDIRRIALNMNQVHTLVPRGTDGKPLSQTVKETDPRATGYLKKYGRKCWELDALDPDDLARIIREPVLEVLDADRWNAAVARQREARKGFVEAAARRNGQADAWTRN